MSKVKSYIKQGSKQVAKAVEQKFIGIGRQIVATELRAEDNVRTALVALMGYTPDQLEKVKAGIKEAWDTHRKTLYEYPKDKKGNVIQPSEKTMLMMLQSTYNRQSEELAVCNAFTLYAGMDEDTAAQFKEQVSEITSYHKLIEYCRHVVRASKGEPLTVEEINKVKKEKGELRANTLKAIERNILLASVEQLKELAQAIAARMRTLKAPAAPTLELVQAKAKRAKAVHAATLKTRKQRKAA